MSDPERRADINLQPGGTLSHYRLVEKIGEGGMGVVFKAYDTRLDRHVALKILFPGVAEDPNRISRIFREGRAAAAIVHPGIATVHQIDEAEGHTFLVMELVEGDTLGALLSGPAAVDPDRLLDIATQIADALAEAHARGIVHSDLKPHNIMLTPGGQVKILDFGLARIAALSPADAVLISKARTLSLDLRGGDGIAGTIAYMSPEQALGKPMDARSDVFSFGTVIYEAATLRHPFLAESATATIARILESSPPPPSDLNPRLLASLEEVILRCLKRKPEDRFSGGQEIAAALRGAVAGTAALSPTTIAILPFAFRGAGSFAYLSEGLVDVLSTKLDGAGELRSVDPHRVLRCAAGWTGRTPGLDEATTLSRHFGAGLFVLGSIVEMAGQLHLDATLYEASGTAVPVAKVDARGDISRIFDMVDEIAVDLLAGRPGGPGARLTKIAATTTGSLDALKAYLDGERLMRGMDRAAAVDSFQRAVAADPSFALAWYRLSVAALWSRRPERAWEAAHNAVQHGARLTDRDRRLLEAFFAVLRGSHREAEILYRQIVGTYPDDVEAWYQLGELLFHYGPQRGGLIRDSRGAWERLLELDPEHLPALIHLGAIAASVGDDEMIREITGRVEAIGPTSDHEFSMRAISAFARRDKNEEEAVLAALGKASDLAVAWTIRFVGVYLGRFSRVLRLCDLLTEPLRATDVRALGHISRACFLAARGKRQAAAVDFEAAERMDRAYALEYRALVSASPFAPLSTEALDALRTEVLNWEATEDRADASSGMWVDPHAGLHPVIRIYILGILDAALGDAASVRRRAAELSAWASPVESRGVVSALSKCLLAHAARAEGDYAQALAILEGPGLETNFYLAIWSPFFSLDHERFVRADLLERVGRSEEALAWYSSFAESGFADLIYQAPSDVRRGEILERLGRKEAAAEHYARFVLLWRTCDPDLAPILEDVQGRLHRLQG
jgi:tetratricopeptide (TPR) repeat protein